MAPLIVGERNAHEVVERDAVDLEHGHPTADAGGVLDSDVVPRGAMP